MQPRQPLLLKGDSIGLATERLRNGVNETCGLGGEASENLGAEVLEDYSVMKRNKILMYALK